MPADPRPAADTTTADIFAAGQCEAREAMRAAPAAKGLAK